MNAATIGGPPIPAPGALTRRVAQAKPAAKRRAWPLPPLASLRVSAFGVAVAVSIVVHAVALSLHFTTGKGRDRDPNPPLEVALVNAKSATKPTKAELLAQANLDGGGNTEQNRRAKTPLPALKPTPRRDVAVASQREEVKANATKEMLTQLRDPTAIPTPEPKPLTTPGTGKKGREATDTPVLNKPERFPF